MVKWRHRPSPLARDLRVTFGVLLGALLVVGGFAALWQRSTDQTLDRLTTGPGPLWVENERLRSAMSRLDASLRAYVVTGSTEFRNDYDNAALRAEQALEAAEDFAEGDAEARVLVSQEAAAIEQWMELYGDPAVAMVEEDPEEAQALVERDIGPELFQEFLELHRELQVFVVDTIADGVNSYEDERRVIRAVVVVAFLVAVVGVVRAHRRLKRDLTKPMEELQATVAQLEAGQLDAHARPRGVAEVQHLAQALNAMTGEIRRLSQDQHIRLENSQRIAEATRTIRASLDRAEVLATAAEAIGETVGCHVCFVTSTSERDQGEDTGAWNQRDTSLPGTPPPSASIHGLGILELAAGRFLEVHDSHDPLLLPAGSEWVERENIATTIIAPVLAAGRVVALVGLHWYEEDHSLDDEERTTVETVCAELGTALGHALLYESQSDYIAQLQELDQAKAEFVSTVSHELRTPLTSIIGYLEMIDDGDMGDLNPEQAQALSVIQTNADRLQSLVNGLLTLSRIEAGRFEVELAPLELGPVVERVIETLLPRAERQSLNLETEIQDDLPLMMADAVHIERMLRNLISNAVKFTPEGGTVRVTAGVADGAMEISVSDTGIGILQEEQAQLFGRFFRGSNVRARAIPGTGLGLAIAKAVVESHGGTILFSSTPGEGTTFTVRLPLAGSSPSAREAEGATDNQSEPEPHNSLKSRGQHS